MHYQIFIPNAPHKTAQALVDVGLPDMLPGAETLPSQGPEDLQGLLCAWRKPGANQRFHYNPGEQTWIQSLPNGPDGAGKGRYWVGFWNDSPVLPDDLQRPYAHYGPMVQLGDGNSWRIPIINELPHDYIRDDDGSWKHEIQRGYHDLWLESCDWNMRLNAGTVTVNFLEILDFCEKIIRQNYRVVPEVVSHLRLLNSQNIATVFGAALDKSLQREGEA